MHVKAGHEWKLVESIDSISGCNKLLKGTYICVLIREIASGNEQQDESYLRDSCKNEQDEEMSLQRLVPFVC